MFCHKSKNEKNGTNMLCLNGIGLCRRHIRNIRHGAEVHLVVLFPVLDTDEKIETGSKLGCREKWASLAAPGVM